MTAEWSRIYLEIISVHWPASIDTEEGKRRRQTMQSILDNPMRMHSSQFCNLRASGHAADPKISILIRFL